MACNNNKYSSEHITALHNQSGLSINQVARAFYVTYNRAWRYSQGLNCSEKKLLELGRYYEKIIIKKGKRAVKKAAGKRKER